MWVFFRGSVPENIETEDPDPSTWEPPYANFPLSSCMNHFHDHQLIINTAWCGDLAGNTFPTMNGFPGGRASCEGYVRDPRNKEALNESYWLINSVKIYKARESCAGAGDDPFSGGFDGCCQDGLQQCLRDWDNDGRYFYRCFADCPELPSPTCTEVGQDPYGQAPSFQQCCGGLQQCLNDWNGNGRSYYLCFAECSSPHPR
eukprot:gb/GFBE01036509.1/.p1 GENE.gb/GFBE01036509.1/~~gb/GFBE01036509.1/.p1  ORF type:complete len:202 (+),score=25.86 gb/GFBE01036509.1/:1-606(+)